MRSAERQCHAERGPAAGLASRVYRPAMQGHEVVHQHKTDPGSLVRARTRTLDAMKPLKEPGEIVWRDADAGVGDSQHRLAVLRSERHTDRALERELEGVREQVEYDLFPHVAIDIDRLR